MFATDAAANRALDANASDGPTYTLHLSETEPEFAGAGFTNITEPVAASYAAQSVAPGDWPAASSRMVQVTKSFPDAVEDWGVLPYWVLKESGVATFAGRFDDPIVAAAGTTGISATVRLESPSSFDL